MWNIVILLYDHFTIKVSPKKYYINSGMTSQRYQPPSSKTNSRYNIVPILGINCPFDGLFGSYTLLHAMGFVVHMVGTIIYTKHCLVTMNYAQSINFYHCCRHQTKKCHVFRYLYFILTVHLNFT